MGGKGLGEKDERKVKMEREKRERGRERAVRGGRRKGGNRQVINEGQKRREEWDWDSLLQIILF